MGQFIADGETVWFETSRKNTYENNRHFPMKQHIPDLCMLYLLEV